MLGNQSSSGGRAAAEPAEYVALDALRHLPPGLAERMMRSLRLNSERLERTEQLVLDLQAQLQKNTPASATCSNSCDDDNDALTQNDTLAQSDLSSIVGDSDANVLLVALISISCGVGITLIACAFIFAMVQVKTSNLPYCSDSSTLPAQTVESSISFSGKRVGEFWRRTHNRFSSDLQRCNESARRLRIDLEALQNNSHDAKVDCPVVKQPMSSKADQIRMARERANHLGAVNLQQVRISTLESDRLLVSRERDTCMACLKKRGGLDGCSEAIQGTHSVAVMQKADSNP